MNNSNPASGNLRGRLLIIGVAVLTFGPFILAWYMAKHPEWVGSTTNYGELIAPPRPIDLADLTVAPSMGDFPLAELKHRWVLAQLAPAGRCEAACQDALHRGKQVWLRLSKDLPRVRRLLVVDGAMDAATLSAVKDGDDTLMLAQAAPGLRQSLEQTAWRRAPGDAADPATTVWLIDPHGNLMMRYSLDYDPHGLLRDLQHLLKISISG